jgi:hypothetical protein
VTKCDFICSSIYAVLSLNTLLHGSDMQKCGRKNEMELPEMDGRQVSGRFMATPVIRRLTLGKVLVWSEADS